MQSAQLKLTVHGNNSHQANDTQTVELTLAPVHSVALTRLLWSSLMWKESNVGIEVFDVESLQVQYPHLEPIRLKK